MPRRCRAHRTEEGPLPELSPLPAAGADRSAYGWSRPEYLARSRGGRILPAYYSDNYVSLLPCQTREIPIAAVPDDTRALQTTSVRLRGWNVESASLAVSPATR